MHRTIRIALAPVLLLFLSATAVQSIAAPLAPVITSTALGDLPFFASVVVSNIEPAKVTSVRFAVKPRRGTVSAPVTAAYSSAYLATNGLLNVGAGTITVPIFGLYEDFINFVSITVRRGTKGVTTMSAEIATPSWNDPVAAAYRSPTVNVSRQKTSVLSYSFFMLKSFSSTTAPLILDTDGYVRWAGSFGFGSLAATLWGNEVWIGQPYSGNVYKQPLTGAAPTLVSDLSAAPDLVTHFHHNMMVTAKGLLVEVDTPTQWEAVVDVLDSNGDVVKTFDLGEILGDYLRDHGEDPTGWVNPGNDWFHGNASTYWPAHNELVVSSRENFVIGLDYDTSEIKWILGDTTKQWYVSFPSLRPLALSLAEGTLAPIGQHSVSIDAAGNLMLFDNGLFAYNTYPQGENRSYSTASTYGIDRDAMTATMIWNYEHGQDIFSPITSSVYQDGSRSILLDYGSVGGGFPGPAQTARIIGLTDMATNRVAFDYGYSGGFPMGWNAIPVHLEALTF